MKILVLGYVVRLPFGGMTWHHLNYVLGLKALGHDVIFLEDSDDFEDTCYDPYIGQMTDDPTAGLKYARSVFERCGFGQRWAYWRASRNQWLGPLASSVVSEIRDADMLINVSGVNPVRDWFGGIPIRVYIDTDPGFQQIRMFKEPDRREYVLSHNRYCTFGSGIADGSTTMPIPDLPWIFTSQPVALDLWVCSDLPKSGDFTSVLSWDSYRTESWNGIEYGMKSTSFEPYFDLPKLTGESFALALSGRNAPEARLRNSGWNVQVGQDVTRTPWTYQDFLVASLAEFSVAKHGYVAGNTGWFSERSACYLAAGRPVITQDTGFGTWLPSGEGLLSFTGLDSACNAIDTIRTDPKTHAAKARAIAEEYFDAGKVLTQLLDAIG